MKRCMPKHVVRRGPASAPARVPPGDGAVTPSTRPGSKSRRAVLASPLLAAAASSTRRARARDIRYFWAWAQAAHAQVERYPIDDRLLAAFVEAHLEGLSERVRATLRRSVRSRGVVR